MRVSTTNGFEITVEDIPNVDKLVSLDVNLQDGTVNFYYLGWKPVAYPLLEVEADDSATMRYDGELDDPDHPRIPEGITLPRRAVKDNPQA